MLCDHAAGQDRNLTRLRGARQRCDGAVELMGDRGSARSLIRHAPAVQLISLRSVARVAVSVAGRVPDVITQL